VSRWCGGLARCRPAVLAHAGLVLVACTALAEPQVRERSVPDVDRSEPAVLDLRTGALAAPPSGAAFARGIPAALRERGDLAYEDADGGLLLVAAGRAVALGQKPPPADVLAGLGELGEREFLRGEEIDAGAWLAVETRGGDTALVYVAARDRRAIQLRWVLVPRSRAAFSPAVLAALGAPSALAIRSGMLPPLGGEQAAVLRLGDGQRRAGPAPVDGLAGDALAALAAEVRAVGDLAVLPTGAGLLLVASGRAASLGAGPVAALAGRDLAPRLRDRTLVSRGETPPGTVWLVAAADGRYAVVRVDAWSAEGLALTWLSQPDGTAVFPDLGAFDASRVAPSGRGLDVALLEAAARGDVAGIERALAGGADVDTVIGRNGRPPLTQTVVGGYSAAVVRLLSAGADPSIRDAHGFTALHVAAKLGRADLVAVLLEAGADPAARTRNGRTPLELALESRAPSTALLGLLRPDGDAAHALATAAAAGDVDALKRQIDEGADVDAFDGDGRSALYVAAAAGQADSVRALIEAGANPLLGHAKEDSVLIAAVRSGDVGSVAALVDAEGLSASHRTEALQRANASGDPALVAVFLDAGVDADRSAASGFSSADHAFRYGNDAVVDAYVEAGHDLTVAGAARLGRIEPLTSLLEAGADPRGATADGRSPLQLAIEHEQSDAIRVLLGHGVDPLEPFDTWDGRTALHEAAQQRDAGLVHLLVDHGANPNALDRVGRSPLYHAVVQGREPAARALLEAGADPALTPPGRSLLEIARTESMRALLADGGAR